MEAKSKPLPKVVTDPKLGVSQNQSRRVTRASTSQAPVSSQSFSSKGRQVTKASANTSSRGPLTRSLVSQSAPPPVNPRTKAQPSAKAAVTRTTRQSTASADKSTTHPPSSRTSRSTASQKGPERKVVSKSTSRVSEPKVVTVVAPSERQSRSSIRTRSTRSSATSAKVTKEESTDDDAQDMHPAKTRALSAGRTPKRGTRATRSQSTARDEDTHLSEDETDAVKPKTASTSSDENSLLAKDNCSSDETSVKPTTSTPFIRPRPPVSSVSDTNSEDDDRTFSEVSNKYISSKRGNSSFAPKDFVFMPPANVSLLKLKPLSPSSTADFLCPGQDHIFTPPTQRAPRAATSSSRKRTPSHRNIRNSLILAHKSPEEGIEILKQSPMIEIKRRTPKHLSPSPMDPMPNLDDIPEDIIPTPHTLNFENDNLAEEPASSNNMDTVSTEKITSSPKRLDSIEEEMECDQSDGRPKDHGGQAKCETVPEEVAEYPAPSAIDVLEESIRAPVPAASEVIFDPEADQSTITDITLDIPEKPEIQTQSVVHKTDSETTLKKDEAEPDVEPMDTQDKHTDNFEEIKVPDSTTSAVAEKAEESAPIHDIKYFRNLLVSESERLTCMCDKWEEITKDAPHITEEVQGQIRTTIGQAQLLMAQRFKQFSGLVDNSEFNTGEKEINCSDLQGFWDMVYFQVEDVDVKFAKLDKLKNNNWVSDEPKIKKVIKKKNSEGKPKTTKPAAGRSNFAAFRAKMKEKQKHEAKEEATKPVPPVVEVSCLEPRVPDDTETPLEASTAVKPEETKTFDAGFFQVSSPVSSPKVHCEAGTPGKTRMQRGSCSPYCAVAVENSFKDSLGSSPMLKTSSQKLDLSYEPSPLGLNTTTAAKSEESGISKGQAATPLMLRKTPRRSLRTPASALRAKGSLVSSGALSPLVTAELKEKTAEAELLVSETMDMQLPYNQPSLFTPEEKLTPRRSRRLTSRQSLRILNFAAQTSSNSATDDASVGLDSEMTCEAAAVPGEDTANFTKYLLPQTSTSETSVSEKENVEVCTPGRRRRSKSASQSFGSPLNSSSRTRHASCGTRQRRMTDILFTPYQKMATPVKPPKEDEDLNSPTINLMSFSPLGQH